LIVAGGGAGAGNNTNAEIYMQFAVDFGPGAPQPAGNNWLTSHTSEGAWNGQNWYSARLDTAQQGGIVSNSTTWMSAYHEDDPNFSGTDESLDPNDLDPNGLGRLANDIFPEGNGGLFTMGTRVNIFYKARYVDSGGTPTTNVWFTFPDTTGGTFLEMEVLPSSAEADSTWNCVLYVDHFNRGAQLPIENGLTSILGSTVSGNFELTPWDRFDVRAESSQQGSFGRPLNTQYNANAIQTFAYKAIVWNSGNLGAFNLVEEDANVLIPWLTLVDTGLGNNNLYVSGDGAAQSMTGEAASEPSATLLLNQWMGVSYTCGTVRDAGCPSGSVLDEVACIEVNTAGGAFVGDDDSVVLVGNGCPQQRSFDVVTTQSGAAGSPAGNEAYSGPLKGTVNYHSVSNAASGGPDYLTVLDGASVHYRSDEATCTDTQLQVTDRLSRVLTYFGYASAQSCIDPTAGLGIGDDQPRGQSFNVALSNFAPNPLTAGRGKVSFTLSQKADAVIEVFDVNGRLVRTLFDSIAEEGVNEVYWDGTDASGASVASGVYFYQLRVENGDTVAKKMLVIQNGGR
ncbi:MAG: T9SS type A sorting domain-containing protein, partial [Candidatus Eisenbacteria bacterium]|nr:T9SS type A sorting domain-containing protein [Candidatus Eisenbacteria bacterium]